MPALGLPGYQVNFHTTTLDINSAGLAAGTSYPTLFISANRPTKQFQTDVVLLGAYISASFATAAAVETAAVALARGTPAELLLLNDSDVFLHVVMRCVTAGITADQLIQRNVGSMFAPPFVPLVSAGDAVSLLGTENTDIAYYAAATLYWLTVPEYHASLRSLGYG